MHTQPAGRRQFTEEYWGVLGCTEVYWGILGCTDGYTSGILRYTGVHWAFKELAELRRFAETVYGIGYSWILIGTCLDFRLH